MRLIQILFVVVQERGEARQYAVTQQERKCREPGDLEQGFMLSDVFHRNYPKVYKSFPKIQNGNPKVSNMRTQLSA